MNTTTDANSQRELLESYVNYLANTLIFNYADLAAFVLVVFEYVVTFDREVQFAWGRRLSWAKSIFLLNRYLTILEYFLVLGPMLPVVNFFLPTFSPLFPAFSGLRIYAISGYDPFITVIVCALAMVPVATNAYVAAYTDIALSELGCLSGLDSQLSTVTWTHTIRAAQPLHLHLSFTSLVLKEGILYFVIVLSLNTIQIVFDLTVVGSYGFIIPFLNVMTPILISRFLFDLDDLRSHDQDVTYPSSLICTHPVEKSSTLQFADPESSVSTVSQHSSGFGLHPVSSRIRDVVDAEEGYKPAATW
ncbi:hypothetical protein C8Q80DRAFT_1317665 [Daedaleopsis nitida]|nr:hypothetical protein C8Q80DRAFT_1317665 [Daedaleopsis nitida]